MSIFNTVVRPNAASPYLLNIIEWKTEKYPILGRLRYVYISEDPLSIVLFLKDGPTSWTDDNDREKLMTQILNHHLYQSHRVCERDSVYIYAHFNIPEETKPLIKSLISHCINLGEDICTDPMTLFDLGIERMKSGAFTERELDFAEKLKNILTKL